jgi:hypothetical protein
MLSEEALAAINERASNISRIWQEYEGAWAYSDGDGAWMLQTIGELLADNDAMRARLAEAEALLEDVAATHSCSWCTEPYPNHSAECLVTQARAWLAADAPPQQP